MYYESSLIEVPEAGEFLKTCNEEGHEISFVTYIVDSQQLLFITKKPVQAKPIFKGKEVEEEE